MNQMNYKVDMEEQTETKLSTELAFSAIEGDGESMKKIGDLLWDGEGFEKDEKRALLWYSLAADNGCISDNLLKFYQKDSITTERLEKMYVWLLKGRKDEDIVNLIKEHKEVNMIFWVDVAINYGLLNEFSWLIQHQYYVLGSALCEQWQCCSDVYTCSICTNGRKNPLVYRSSRKRLSICDFATWATLP